MIQVVVSEEQFAWIDKQAGRSRSEFLKQLIAEKYPDFPSGAAWGLGNKKLSKDVP